jgi:hypothetical protein
MLIHRNKDLKQMAETLQEARELLEFLQHVIVANSGSIEFIRPIVHALNANCFALLLSLGRCQ